MKGGIPFEIVSAIFRVSSATADVPTELVQKVTGHKTTEIVLRHYFQPGREDFHHAICSTRPFWAGILQGLPLFQSGWIIRSLRGWF